MDFACTNFNIHHVIPGTMDVNTSAKDILTKAVSSKVNWKTEIFSLVQ